MAHPIEELASRVFAARNIAHREHWKSKGFAAHEALGEFYDGIIGAVDDLIEVEQGMYGLIDDFTVTDSKPTDIAGYIRAEAKWIEKNRSKISDCAAVLALVDDLIAIYLRAAYKLTNLK